ncbi:MAG: type III-A CRISPR-associated protein Cas10/Csm1 [Candidatus Woesearchaeota archaeon]
MKNYFEDENYVGTILAALLHDIGKYAQKFGVKGTHEEIGKTKINCSTLNLRYDLNSKYFIIDNSNQKNLVANKIVHLADWIAASERHNEVEEEQKIIEKSKYLINILSEVNISEDRDLDENEIKEEEEISNDINVKFIDYLILNFYLNEIEKYSKRKEEIFPNKEIYTEFQKNLNIIIGKEPKENKEENHHQSNEHPLLIIKKVSDFLKKYTLLSSSAWYYSRSDISLYSHSKLTAAIASCLYILNDYGLVNLNKLEDELKDIFDRKKRFFEDRDNKGSNKVKEQILEFVQDSERKLEIAKNNFLLIHGNFSGIQKFISRVYSKNALKMLKARSTYLSLLNELIPLKLTHELCLTELNVVFAGGGNFEIISPNTEDAKNKIKEFVKKINNEFWKRYHGDLFLEISIEEISALMFDRIFYFSMLQNEKRKEPDLTNRERKFYNNIKETINTSFLDEGLRLGEENEKFICDVCKKIDVKKYKDHKDDDVNYCKDCYSLKKLSDFLKKIQAQEKEDFVDFNEIKYLFSFEDLDLLDYWKLIFNKKINVFPNEIPFEIIPLGYPIDNNGKLLTFEELSKKSKGVKKLGALKLDVDNLGKIFNKGVKGISFSRYYQLSTLLNYFFKGYVYSLRNNNKYKDSVYVIFSGGDDAFFIGSWDKLLEFAFDLYYLFKCYSGNNNYVNLSASFLIFDEIYPVYKVYDELEEMLDLVKNKYGKNKINVCGLILDWSDIFNAKIYRNISEDLNKELLFVKNDEKGILELISSINLELSNHERTNELRLFIDFLNLFYSLLNKNLISRSYLHQLLWILNDPNNQISIDRKYRIEIPKIYLIRYGFVRNLKNIKIIDELEEKEIILSDLLWDIFKKYTSLVILKKLSFNLISYSIMFALYSTKKEVKKDE